MTHDWLRSSPRRTTASAASPRRVRREHRLPGQPGTLIGREKALELATGLMRSETRLLTITGTAGAGKTRLALEVARRLSDDFPDGVWFVDLAPIRDPHSLHTAIGRSAGAREQRGELARAHVERAIAERPVLLVLDNFEQLLDAAVEVAGLLTACPRLKILVTSRAPLRLRWEQILPLPPLAVPDRHQLPPPDRLAEVAAVALYVERAQAVDPTFSITSDNAAAVAEICIRLDGLPLAIELAAARSDVFAPMEVLGRLRQRFELLSQGAVDLPARQQSLEAAFDWGYDLLKPHEQALFRALGVLTGGFDLAGARAVGGALATEDSLTTLVQHSLLRHDADRRFRMLETVREYALERLTRHGERDSTCERHALFMLDLAERAVPALRGSSQAAEWLARLEREHDDLIAALAWATEDRKVEVSLRLAAALWRFWWLRGHLSEGMAWFQTVLQMEATEDGAQPARAMALNGAGVLAHVRGEYSRALTYLSESLELSRELRLPSLMAAALHNLGALAREQGDWSRARAAYDDSLALERELGNAWGIATSLTNLGALAEDQGDTARAGALLQESLALLREIGDARGIAAALHNLAAVARDAGDLQQSTALQEESLGLWRRLGDRWGVAASLHDLARAVEQLGDWHRSARLLGESLRLFGEMEVRQGIAACFVGLAAVACAADRALDAAWLLGAAEVLRESVSAPLPRRDRRDLDGIVAAARRSARSSSFHAAWRNGRSLGAEAAVARAHALAATLSGSDWSSDENPGQLLTVREQEVAALIVEGLTNRQIAERLVISERTADRHVSNILARLGASTRAHVASMMTRTK